MPGPIHGEAFPRVQAKVLELALAIGGERQTVQNRVLYVTEPDPGWLIYVRHQQSGRATWAFVKEKP